MLPKSKRLSTKHVTALMAEGKSTHTPFFVLRANPTQGTNKFSVSVPKKVAKTAVERNKIRRQVFSILKKLETQIKTSFNIIIIVKINPKKLVFKNTVQEIKTTFVKSGLLK